MKDHTYFIVRDDDGIDYLCPLKSTRERGTVTEHEMEYCVEKEVVERYSGNINIVTEQ